MSSFRRRHSAPRISPLAFVYASSICTSIHSLNDTIYAKNSVVRMMNERVSANLIHTYLLSERALATFDLLTKSSTVGESVNNCRKTRFVSLLDRKATLYDLDHSRTLYGMVFFLARDWERGAPLIELRKCGLLYFTLVAIIILW